MADRPTEGFGVVLAAAMIGVLAGVVVGLIKQSWLYTILIFVGGTSGTMLVIAGILASLGRLAPEDLCAKEGQ